MLEELGRAVRRSSSLNDRQARSHWGGREGCPELLSCSSQARVHQSGRVERAWPS